MVVIRQIVVQDMAVELVQLTHDGVREQMAHPKISEQDQMGRPKHDRRCSMD